MTAKEAWIALNMMEGLGPIRVRQLLEHFGNAPDILKANPSQLTRLAGLPMDVAERLANWQKIIDLHSELGRIKDYGCEVLTWDDDAYPPLLRQIYDPPVVLYVKGRILEADRHGVSLVGTRQTTPYGLEVARRLGFQLGGAGVTVISGGARGVDTAAHRGALLGGGRTLAVLGTGINIVFPPENAALFEKIASQGAVLTQFPFNRPADKQSFPIRNRIVAGLSLGTVVVEANRTSGALITAHFAADYGRQVFAVPGRIDSPRSKGCHDLIKKGAKLCESLEDILSEFEYLFPRSATEGSVAAGVSPVTRDVSDSERRILELMPSGGTQGIDELIRGSGFSSERVVVALMRLELKRLVRQLPGKLFERIGG